MPFKLRLKKSRQYNVVSKSLFVLCVELLDGSSVECTLSAESSGQECLLTVCQRLGLHQPEFFGLRYTARHGPPQLRWVEADRPLKRQIDKHAREPSLMLRVMYYVPGVHLLTDEMTRYHYFLQLKMDVIEGRISCDANQAVLLASYSMQAEFGNHDMERHTAEYLRDFVLFPKHLTEQGHLESLTEAVIHQHSALAGLAQGTAEEFYILAAQKLDGYGIEHFAAKDDQGLDVILGISLSGILVNGTEAGQPISKFYPWKNIANVISHKRSFGIEGQPSETASVEFHLSEAECAKYIWRLCVYQHTFFAQNEQALIVESTTCLEGGEPHLHVSIHQPVFQADNQMMDSYDDLDIATSGNPSNASPLPNPSTNSTVQIIHPGSTLLTSTSNVTSTNSAVALHQQRAQSTSCLDLASTSTTSAHIDKLRSLLPSYRSAPDYETAMQLKYRASSQAAAAAAAAAAAGMYLYSSQPEIHQTHARENVNSFNHYKPYPDVTRISQHAYEEGQPVADFAMLKYRRDLEAAGLDQQLLQGLQLVQVYKPPPPYPNGRPSSSTPDLASQAFGAPIPPCFNPHVSGSSPDLVSSRSLGIQTRRHHEHQQQLLPNPDAHRTYANLAAVAESEVSRYPPAAASIGSSNATQSGLLYSYPLLSGHPTLLQSNRYPHQEPIYENVPLPWQAAEAVRSRASSIQSAPERSIPTMQPATPQRRKSHTAAPSESNPNFFTTATAVNEMRGDVTLQTQTQTQTTSPILVTQTTAVTSNNELFINSTIASTSSSNSNTSGKNKIKKKFALFMGGGKNSKEKSRKDSQAADELQHKWSTGLPRMPLPPNISKENMCQLLERKLVDSQLFFEFEKIPKKKPNADFSTALLPENASRNRFKELLPYEENRVRIIPSKENRTGYINASHIAATVGSQARFYIAAQGPLPATINNFWQMIWEADVYLVVMLTGLHDDDTSADYFPVIGDRCLQVGEFQIWRQFSQETGHCVTSKLRVFHTIARRSRGVWHLRYAEWGDQGYPNSVGHFLGFLEELNSIRQQATVEVPAGHNGNPPMLVHCTGGVGRTGVVILGDLLLYTLDHNQELDVPRVVTQLRQQRMLMVQTVAQYRFVYSLLIYYLKHSRLI